jgi:hypothetical protein
MSESLNKVGHKEARTEQSLPHAENSLASVHKLLNDDQRKQLQAHGYARLGTYTIGDPIPDAVIALRELTGRFYNNATFHNIPALREALTNDENPHEKKLRAAQLLHQQLRRLVMSNSRLPAITTDEEMSGYAGNDYPEYLVHTYSEIPATTFAAPLLFQLEQLIHPDQEQETFETFSPEDNIRTGFSDARSWFLHLFVRFGNDPGLREFLNEESAQEELVTTLDHLFIQRPDENERNGLPIQTFLHHLIKTIGIDRASILFEQAFRRNVEQLHNSAKKESQRSAEGTYYEDEYFAARIAHLFNLPCADILSEYLKGRLPKQRMERRPADVLHAISHFSPNSLLVHNGELIAPHETGHPDLIGDMIILTNETPQLLSSFAPSVIVKLRAQIALRLEGMLRQKNAATNDTSILTLQEKWRAQTLIHASLHHWVTSVIELVGIAATGNQKAQAQALLIVEKLERMTSGNNYFYQPIITKLRLALGQTVRVEPDKNTISFEATGLELRYALTQLGFAHHRENIATLLRVEGLEEDLASIERLLGLIQELEEKYPEEPTKQALELSKEPRWRNTETPAGQILEQQV